MTVQPEPTCPRKPRVAGAGAFWISGDMFKFGFGIVW